ncbi:hypothetical protein [Tunturiibacter lichenicola]|uniref:hypothetical protein n=1 Tax=Tunturiibacter lichenicola TaxID=2051959 RepID=UPI003D9AED02
MVQPKVVICDDSASCTHQFINGQKFKILTTDDVVIIVSLGMGERYMRADVSVSNNSPVAVDVLPADMRLEVITPKEKALPEVSPEQIAKSLGHRAAWANALNGMGGAMARQQTTTQTSSSGTINNSGTVNTTSSDGTYTNGTYNGSGTYTGNSASTTSSPDYAAQARANERIRERNAAVASLQSNLMQTSLRANTVATKQTVRGFVYFEREKHADLVHLTIPVGGTVYEFPFQFIKK